RMIGESFDQLDLLLSERPHLQAISEDDAKQFIPLEHRHGENGPKRLDIFRRKRIFGVGQYIVDVDRAAFESSSARSAVPPGPDRMVGHPRLELRRRATVRNHAEHLAIEAVNESEPRVAKAHRTLGYGLKYRPQIESRAADDLEQIGGRGLLLQGFGGDGRGLGRAVWQGRGLDRADGVGGGSLGQFDLLVGKRPNLLAIDCNGTDQLVLLEHRYGNHRPSAAECDDLRAAEAGRRIEVPWFGLDIGDLNRLFRRGRACERDSGGWGG